MASQIGAAALAEPGAEAAEAKGYETQMLESAISKISGLLRVGGREGGNFRGLNSAWGRSPGVVIPTSPYKSTMEKRMKLVLMPRDAHFHCFRAIF